MINTGRGANDYHIVTTTNPYLIELGLGSFTMQSLSRWWNEKTSNGIYLHRLCINTGGLPALLGITEGTEFFWHGWKPHTEIANVGVYQKYDLSAYMGDGDSPWKYQSAAGPVTAADTLLATVAHPVAPIVGGKTDASSSFSAIYDTLDASVLAGLSPIYDLINLNRYMSAFSTFFPRSTWDATTPNADIGGIDTKKLFASHELLVDIKTAKMGRYIEWSGEVAFSSGPERVSFKLHLFDDANSDVSDKIATIKSLKYSAPKRDATGRKYRSKVDGEYEDYNNEDSSSFGLGDIDLSMNPFTRKWESGSPVLLAKMVTALGVGIAPDVGELKTSDIKLALESEEYSSSKFIPASGIAMPIRLQNGNPLQWQPNYLSSKDIRREDEENIDYTKETLTVYNFSSQSQFKENETVMLTRIEGVWQVSSIGTEGGVDTAETEVVGAVGKWGEFTYMATNHDYLFRTKTGAKFAPKDAELSFHRQYYDRDPLNEGKDYGEDGGYDRLQTFNTTNTDPIEIDHCYWQTTSFDHLDKLLYGIRDGNCSISTTSATINAAGSIIPSPEGYTHRNAAHAGTFFGCIFPAGYNKVGPYLAAGGRDWIVTGKSTGGMAVPGDYFDTTAATAGDQPFYASNSTDARNNCRQQAQAEPMGEIGEDGNPWSRRDSRASASLFAENVANGLTTFPQMPADVMLNASPSGEFGSPLYPVHRFSEFHTSNTDKTLLAAQAFLQGSYLGKDGVTLGPTAYSDTASAFDFPPVSNNLMFRPLKMEGYVQFGKRINDDPALSKVADLSKETIEGSRIAFSVEAHRTQLDDKRPCSMRVDAREEPKQTTGIIPPFFGDHGLAWGAEVKNKPKYNYLHDFNYWYPSNGPLSWQGQQAWQVGTDPPNLSIPGDWRGAGAYGVITTFTTVSANDRIDFTTDNIYGMGAAADGFAQANIVSVGRGTPQARSWGVSSFQDSYRQENIIDLSVRIFQQHPRDQLLYDPRTFAVHHFNPDVRYKGDFFVKDDGDRINLTPVRNSEVEEGIKGKDAGGDPILYEYNYPLPSSQADFQEICRFQKHTDHYWPASAEIHQDGELYTPVALGDGDLIFRNACLDNGGTVYRPPVMPQKFWKVNTTRVGKLLPYRYHRKEVGLPVAEGDVLVLLPLNPGDATPRLNRIDSTQLADTPVGDLAKKMIVKSLGEGYSIGNMVGIAKNDVSFKVKGIGAKGIITQLECVSRGTGITAAQCASSGDLFSPDSTNASLALKTLSDATTGAGEAVGEGFDAYFVASQVYNKVHTDPKPYLIKNGNDEIVRVAADKANMGTPSEDTAFVNESHEVSFTLDPTVKSKNSQYDVFFHFHNDISMTWLAGKTDFHGDAYNSTECSEQHVTVRINPR